MLLEYPSIIHNEKFVDERGFFRETYRRTDLEDIDFVQENESYSKKNVFRGFHYQTGEHAQAKLVRVSYGEIIDFAIDMRKNSDTYLDIITAKLTHLNGRQLFVPRGFAHGFYVVSNEAVVSYKVDNYYNKESEAGINYMDDSITLEMDCIRSEFIVSDKDKTLPFLSDAILF